MRRYAILALLFFAFPVGAEPLKLTPNEVRNTYPLVNQSNCTDNETGQAGQCFLFSATGEYYYLVFTQEGSPVLMRYVVPGLPYTEVWRRDLTPQSTSL